MTPSDEARLLHDHIIVYRLDGDLFLATPNVSSLAVTDVRVVILRL